MTMMTNLQYNLHAMRALDRNPRDARHGVDPSDLPEDTRSRWSDVPHDEQVDIVDSWLYTQHDHRSLVSEWLSQTKSSNGFVTDFLLYMARVMVVRGQNIGWVL